MNWTKIVKASEGWNEDNEVIQKLKDQLAVLGKIEYELNNQVKGAFTDAKTPLELMLVIKREAQNLIEIADELNFVDEEDFTRTAEENNLTNKIQSIFNKYLDYHGINSIGKMINPGSILKKYESDYAYIRPKSFDYGNNFIEYVSQGFDEAQVMFEMIYEAISKDPEVKKAFDDGKLVIKVCSRDNWGEWEEFGGGALDFEDLNSIENRFNEEENDEDYIGNEL